MIEDINCGQLFQRRSDWQEKAFNELKDDLTATKDNRFLKYQDENETYLVMICGKSQIGKSTLILKMIGIRDENFNDVYNTLRAGSPQGNSSTVTAIIYAKSATDKYALAFAKLDEPTPEKKYYDAKEMVRGFAAGTAGRGKRPENFYGRDLVHRYSAEFFYGRVRSRFNSHY